MSSRAWPQYPPASPARWGEGLSPGNSSMPHQAGTCLGRSLGPNGYVEKGLVMSSLSPRAGVPKSGPRCWVPFIPGTACSLAPVSHARETLWWLLPHLARRAVLPHSAPRLRPVTAAELVPPNRGWPVGRRAWRARSSTGFSHFAHAHGAAGALGKVTRFTRGATGF